MTEAATDAAQTPADAPDTAETPDNPAGPETAASGPHSPETSDDLADGSDGGGDGQDDGKQFDHAYVQKLRREAASLRDRARTAEATVAALQRKQIEAHITAVGLKPAALWAVSSLEDLLGDDGTPDAGKLNTAVNTARQQLGITERTPAPGRGTALRSGSGVPHEKPRGFAAAFGPKPK